MTPRRHKDNRGVFMESFRDDWFPDMRFIQDNHSASARAGTIRGLHFQAPPYAQAKLVRCTRGSVLDVAVDIRRGSASYGRYVSAELSAENAAQLLVPAGFLHGFVTLEDDSEVQYKCTGYYAPDAEGTVLWDDSDLGIDWGDMPDKPMISERDAAGERFADFQSPFRGDAL